MKLFYTLDKRDPDHLKTQEMWIEAVSMKPRSLACIPDRFKTQRFKTEAMCIKVLR